MTTLATPTPLASGDPRTAVPLFTLRECAAYLQTPLSTLHAWVRPKDGAPLVTVLTPSGRQATVPFVGFAEAFVLGALRQAGVPMQRIRPAVKKLDEEIGLEHALASRQVYTDGAELIYDYASHSGDEELLTVVRTGQEHLARRDPRLPATDHTGTTAGQRACGCPHITNAEVTVDPRQAFGQPMVVHGGAGSRTSWTASRLVTASPRSRLTSTSHAEVEDVIRVALRLAA